MSTQKGLYGKYKIEKTDGTPVDPKAQYFVLRVDTDPAAREALLIYASIVYATNPAFAVEIYSWLESLPEIKE